MARRGEAADRVSAARQADVAKPGASFAPCSQLGRDVDKPASVQNNPGSGERWILSDVEPHPPALKQLGAGFLWASSRLCAVDSFQAEAMASGNF